MVWYSHFVKNFPVCCDPHKGFSVVNVADVDVVLEFSCFFDDSADVGKLISGSSTFSNQLEHLEVHSSCIAEAWLGDF